MAEWKNSPIKTTFTKVDVFEDKKSTAKKINDFPVHFYEKNLKFASLTMFEDDADNQQADSHNDSIFVVPEITSTGNELDEHREKFVRYRNERWSSSLGDLEPHGDNFEVQSGLAQSSESDAGRHIDNFISFLDDLENTSANNLNLVNILKKYSLQDLKKEVLKKHEELLSNGFSLN